MHSKPVPSIDERISSHKLGHKRLVKVWFFGEIELRHASLGDDAAVIRLRCESTLFARVGLSRVELNSSVTSCAAHIHNVNIAHLLL